MLLIAPTPIIPCVKVIYSNMLNYKTLQVTMKSDYLTFILEEP